MSLKLPLEFVVDSFLKIQFVDCSNFETYEKHKNFEKKEKTNKHSFEKCKFGKLKFWNLENNIFEHFKFWKIDNFENLKIWNFEKMQLWKFRKL